MWVQFAVGAINGKYDDNRVFLSLIEAMVGKVDRSERKVGNQNFKYTKEVVDFSQLIMTISPQSYRYMRPQLQLPTLRYLQCVCSAIPHLGQPFLTNRRILRSQSHKFPRSICDECFMHARDYINSVEYTGPVTLACDDTKLHPSLQVYWDTALETHVLVGTTSTETIVVANPEELKLLLLEYEDKVATKV